MNLCPQAGVRLGTPSGAGMMCGKEPPSRYRDFARRLRFVTPLALLILPTFLAQGQTNDAVSREVSLFNSGPAPAAGIEAISRELSVFNSGPAPAAGIEAISSELSVFNSG